MKRAILIVFIALGLAGCKSQTPTVDPFFGRTTVPPPATGSISGQAADPYYQSNNQVAPPYQQPGLQPNASYNYNRGSGPTNITNAPLYSGPGSTNAPGMQQYSMPANSALTGQPPAATSGNLSNPFRSAPQTNPALSPAPAGYSPQTPAAQMMTPPAQPASTPSTWPGTTQPGVNRYAPAGSYNYQGSSIGTPNQQPATPSPNRVSTPFFAGGVPNRTSIPAANNSQSTNPSIPYSNINNTNPNYLVPASRQYSVPTPAQPANNSQQSPWRESTSSDSRLIDDNIKTVSGAD